jgi:hypothetical protein
LTSTVVPSDAFFAVITGADAAVAGVAVLLFPPPPEDVPDPHAAARMSDAAVSAAVPRVPM